MVEISSMEYAFSKLDFKKESNRKDRKSKERLFKIYYRDENDKIQETIRSEYDLQRSRDIHANIITMVDLTLNRDWSWCENIPKYHL